MLRQPRSIPVRLVGSVSGMPSTVTRRVYLRGVRGDVGDLGWRIADRLAECPGIEVVVAPSDEPAYPATTRRFDTVVDVGIADHDRLGQRRQSVTVGAAGMLDDARVVGASHLVVLTSAMVYGALANNPVPLTEEAVLRPDPTFVYARQLAAAEAEVEQWRTERPGRSATVLRPAIPVAETGTSSLASALTAGFGLVWGEADPDAQFVHHDDVASAVVLAVERGLDGVYNVAPDGSIPGERVRALSGRSLRIPLPGRIADVVAALRWRFQRGPIPPGLLRYTRATWVVANDKLRAEGWAPTVTNEQAFVEGTEAKWWTTVTPKRRQELALGTMVAVLAAGGITAAVLIRRWWLRTR